MDWNAAIERNREALKRVLAALVAMAGLGQSAIGSRQSELAADGAHTPDCPLPTADCRTLLPRHLHRAVLRLLRPAEAAARRLVIVAARGIVVTLPPVRPREQDDTETFNPPPPRIRSAPPPASRVADGSQAGCPSSPPETGGEAARPQVWPVASPKAGSARRRGGLLDVSVRHHWHGAANVNGKVASTHRLAFPLFDPLPRWRLRRPAASGVPRISIPGFSVPFPVPVRRPPSPHDSLDATRLALRLAALASALDDLPRQARRFARWQARRANSAGMQNQKTFAAEAQTGQRRGTRPFRRLWPLRPGRPPGQRPASSRRPAHEIHEVLADLQYFAFKALDCPDTS